MINYCGYKLGMPILSKNRLGQKASQSLVFQVLALFKDLTESRASVATDGAPVRK